MLARPVVLRLELGASSPPRLGRSVGPTRSMDGTFACIPADEWCLAAEMERPRRNALLEDIPFAQIVALIAQHAKLTSFKQETLDNRPAYQRVVIVLETEPKAVDLFHNSRCGYRAQYYRSVANGERANEYAVRTLLPKVKELLAGKEMLPWAWVEKSLSDSEAKVWIHQGPWLRYRRISDRKICIQRWVSKLQSPERCDRKKALWGSLSASGEKRIDIKGGFVDSNGNPLGGSLKPSRGHQIHDFGFT